VGVMDHFDDVFFVLLGALASMAVTLFVEHLRRPIVNVLSILKKEPINDHPKRTHVQLFAENEESMHSFLGRKRADDTRGSITINGLNTYIVNQPIRWCDTKQPNLPRIIQEAYPNPVATDLLIYDASYLRDEPYVNIFSGDTARFDLFIYLHEKNETYFFSNESYKNALGSWDYPAFRIMDNDLSVIVELVVSGVKQASRLKVRNALDPDKISVEIQ
jgi:hypothetical protein